MTIVKVQVPLATSAYSADAPPLLIYAEGRVNETLQPVTEVILKALNGEPKGYFDAAWTGTQWVIGARVANQRW